MFGINDNLESNIKPTSLASPMIGMCVSLGRVKDLNVASVVDQNEHTYF